MNINVLIKRLEKENLIKDKYNHSFNIDYISYNSKDIKNNTLFICKGMAFKEEYLDQAIESGATCYISEKDYKKNIPAIIVTDVTKAMAVAAKWFYEKYDSLTKIGITGTKGKTTTLNFIKNILKASGNNPAYFSTIDFYTGSNNGKSHNTTPEVIDIYRGLKDAKESGIKNLVMEVSSQAYKKNRVYGINYDIGIFTNIGCDHISKNEHKDFEDYFSCKMGFIKNCKTVILYKQIDHYDRIIKEIKDKKIITYGVTKDCDYYINNIKPNGAITTFDITSRDKTRTFSIKMAGSFNVINATSAIVVADQLNIDYESIKEGLYKTEVLGRMNTFNCGGVTVIVDYAHNYMSGKAFGEAIKNNFPDKNLKLVFGCPGDKGLNRRKEMASIANEYASFVYITMEDPQSQNVSDISEEIASYLKIPHTIINDRRKAIKTAIEEANKDDVIGILGKGHENYQIINGKYEDYETDVEVVKNISEKVLEGSK